MNIPSILAELCRVECSSSKSWKLQHVDGQNSQTDVARLEIAVCQIFLQKMKIYILSFQEKKNWYKRIIIEEMTTVWSGGEIGENRRKSNLFTLGGARAGKSGILADFASHFITLQFLRKIIFRIKIFFLKAENINFHFLQK